MVFADTLLEESYMQLCFHLTAWTGIFFGGACGLFFSLYIVIRHEDLETKLVEPIYLSQVLRDWMPREYYVSIIIQMFALAGAPWYFTLLALPNVLINLKQYRDKDHLAYFMTAKEYTNSEYIVRLYLVKSLFYMSHLGVGFGMGVLTVRHFI